MRRQEVPEPRLYLMDAGRLLEAVRMVHAGSGELAPAARRLRDDADGMLGSGPFSVTEKEELPPSGDPHDYMSRGPYWWPDPEQDDGLPYIRRDGEVNPGSRVDRIALSRMLSGVGTLACGWLFFRKRAYADHAARLLRVWFLEPETRMNPHLEYAQGIPGRCEGRGIGIIDTRRFCELVDMLGILEASGCWGEGDRREMEAWLNDYLDWLLESEKGRNECGARNNHGTWYDVQVAAVAFFTGRNGVAERTLERVMERRIAEQIEPDGRQPLELERTKALGYSCMNLLGLFNLATLGETIGLDLWNATLEDGRGIRAALEWLIPHLIDPEGFPHAQIKPLSPGRALAILRRASLGYHRPRYEDYMGGLDLDLARERINLLYPSPKVVGPCAPPDRPGPEGRQRR